jgi:PAS domain S-box-containing protein
MTNVELDTAAQALSNDPSGSTVARAILEQLPDALIYADRLGIIRVWSAGAARVFGYTATEALGQSLDIIVPERFRQAHWDGFHAALAAGATKYSGKAMTTRAVNKDGEKVYVEMSFGIVRDQAGAVVGAVAVGRDCTDRRQGAAT